jgi:hypothetical protein
MCCALYAVDQVQDGGARSGRRAFAFAIQLGRHVQQELEVCARFLYRRLRACGAAARPRGLWDRAQTRAPGPRAVLERYVRLVHLSFVIFFLFKLLGCLAGIQVFMESVHGVNRPQTVIRLADGRVVRLNTVQYGNSTANVRIEREWGEWNRVRLAPSCFT